MSQARDIIAGHLDEPTRDAEFFAGNALDALRSAANASPTDTITIGPDGTVGRLVWPKTEDGFDAAAITPEVHGRKVGWYGLRTDGRLESPDLSPLYRVVTP